MPVASAVAIKGRGTVIVGTVEAGIVHKTDKLELVGHGLKTKTACGDIHIFGKPVAEAKAGDHVGVLCRGLKTDEVRRGMWLVAPGSLELRNQFKAEFYLLAKDEGGRATGIRNGFTQKLHCTTWDQVCRLNFTKNADLMMPGDHMSAIMTLLRPMPLDVGVKFSYRDVANDQTIGSGVITEVLPNVQVNNLNDLKAIKVSE